MTVLVCLGDTPDTWWQARNSFAWDLLDRAAQAAPNEAAREAIIRGSAVHSLDLYEMESPLREQVWEIVEQTARQLSNEMPGEPPLWPAEWLKHAGDLAHEMQARRIEPDRPGAWPAR